MVDYDFTTILRELLLEELLIQYLIAEQKKRREELDALQRQFNEIVKEHEKQCAFMDVITSTDFIKRIEDPDLKKKVKRLALRWKKARKTCLLKKS